LASVEAGAEATLRDLQGDTSAVWEQRRTLLDDIRETAKRLTEVADAADEREATEPDLLDALRPAVPDGDGQPTEVLDAAPADDCPGAGHRSHWSPPSRPQLGVTARIPL